MLNHSEYLADKKNLVSEKALMTQDIYNFYMKVFQAQEKYQEAFVNLAGNYKMFISGSLPVLTAESISLDEETKTQLNNLMLDLTGAVTGMNSGMDFSALSESFKSDTDELLRSILKHDFVLLEKKAAENRLSVDEYIFIIHNVFKPFMVALRTAHNRKIEREDWLESTCPFCGYFPDMSKIIESKDNQKLLHCAMCENQWEFPRMQCHVCGCNEQSKQGFFEYEDNNIYRVYYCDECSHYIKNVRITKLVEESKFDLAVEDVITNFLDASMMEKGYKRI
jgi:formate dehydrogenase maturation protein FdhE